MKKIGINIWDDFDEAEGSYIYVEEDLGLDEKKKILEHVLPQIKKYFDPKVKFSFYLYDTKNEFPELDRSPENLESRGWKDWSRWEIKISPISYEELETVMYEKGLAELSLDYNGKEVYFYSES